MRRITKAVAAAAAVAMLAAACGSGGGSGGSTSTDGATSAPVRGNEDLVIWTDDTKLQSVKDVADAFGAANGITVGVQAIVNTRADFITANQAGNGPDVLVGAHDWIGQLVANGAIDPVQLGTDTVAMYSGKSIEAVTYNNQIYGVPYSVEALALFCNKSVVGTTEFATLDDAIAAGQQAKDAGTVQSALNVPQGTAGDPYHMQPLYTSAGGYLFGKNSDGSLNPDDLGVGTQAGIDAAKKIATLGDAGSKVLSTSISNDNAISLFASGKAACLISGPWALGDVRNGLGNDGYSLQPIPGFAGMDPAQPFAGVNAFYVASNGKNKSYAQAFVTGTTTGGLSTVEAMTTLFDANNLPPAMTQVRDAVAPANPDVEIFATAADSAAPMPSIPAMDQVWTPLGVAYANIITGADPATEMTKAADTIKAAIAKS
ncbi:MAG: extracellular solute-binding protein [Micrococcales bacterium]|nr:extracellular solute-binding protein [Micrococcales bacterium]